MTVTVVPPAPPGAPSAWDRRLRAALDVVHVPAPRAVLVGNAGSGKSAGIRMLHDALVRDGRDATLLRTPSAGVDRIPHSHVLLIDDMQLWDDGQLEAVRLRAEDPGAALIVAGRPWPASPAMRELTRTLEHDIAPIVLGRLLRSDVLDRRDGGALIAPDCLDHVFEITGGVTWLVVAALQRHDERDCTAGPAHDELDESLAELVAHRLDGVDADLRHLLEAVCAAPLGRMPALADATREEWTQRAHAEGLLLRSGEPVPIVRRAVRAATSMHRLIEIGIRIGDAAGFAAGDGLLLEGVDDERIAAALTTRADDLLAADPATAAGLYRRAIACGASAADLAPRRAQAAWSSGDIDEASVLADDVLSRSGPDASGLTGVAAAVWSARAMLDRSDAAYRLAPPDAGIRLADAAVAALAIGAPAPSDPIDASTAVPTTIDVSMELLRRGLAASVAADGDEQALRDLVRAAEVYTASRASGPMCELPAVIAAITALNLGMLPMARTVIDDAIAGDHGGPWARRRLLLWRAWIAVQRARPRDARAALQAAEHFPQRPGARDHLLAHAVRIALARRYDDTAMLEAAWDAARDLLLRADIDLYLVHPFGEFVSAASRLGEAARVEPHLTRLLAIVDRLGDPPLWTTHLRWSALQQGILLSSPDRLAPHAKALVAAAGRSPVAATMAKAGRVWTSVLAGQTDADAIVSAAEELSAIGLMWDAARLAGHGAARTPDRKVAAQLLSCARQMHPGEGAPHPAPVAVEAEPSTVEPLGEVLSEREIEVAQLVLRGKTYAEIGDAIFISPRTVEHHVAHIRRRLGATSRSDVLARLRLLLGEPRPGAGQTDAPP
ncbi:LuxR C-terminal-related transcriptional regulator [Microbacterium sp. NPDC058342]|uniref:helix-turn-helix transcriptional regulator n=1 Tax=Microbacterium sp. NPDC058342 TaxID=3346454 RepID=UPI00365A22D6